MLQHCTCTHHLIYREIKHNTKQLLHISTEKPYVIIVFLYKIVVCVLISDCPGDHKDLQVLTLGAPSYIKIKNEGSNFYVT